VVKGGKLRRENIHIIRVSVGCGQTYLLRRYHVMRGAAVFVYLNNQLVATATAPALR
jgi:hypothetical protein